MTENWFAIDYEQCVNSEGENDVKTKSSGLMYTPTINFIWFSNYALADEAAASGGAQKWSVPWEWASKEGPM